MIGDVRGEGLLAAVEFVQDPQTKDRFPEDVGFGNRVRQAARRRGLLLRTSPWMAVFAPPLTTSDREIDEILDIFEAALAAALDETRADRPLAMRAMG